MLAVGAVSVMAVFGGFSMTGSAVATEQNSPQIFTATYTDSDGVEPPAILLGPNGEKPTEWGVAVIPADVTGPIISPMTTKSVGGGTWSYEVGTDGINKACSSKYIHPSKKHSATAVIGSKADKVIKEKDIWANAYATAGLKFTCETYWGVY
ncbi:hypothetical protein SSBG_02360 [Streptomyces sp. SPB074]|nr:hypothetical protein SSBG_02360 [Streptomyces sp. SPB074]